MHSPCNVSYFTTPNTQDFAFWQENGETDEEVPLTAASQAAEGPSGEVADAQDSGQAQKGMAGMGANLVSTVRSFLPFVSKAGDAQPQPAAGKKPVKVHSTLPGIVNNQELMNSHASQSGVSMTQIFSQCRPAWVQILCPSGCSVHALSIHIMQHLAAACSKHEPCCSTLEIQGPCESTHRASCYRGCLAQIVRLKRG